MTPIRVRFASIGLAIAWWGIVSSSLANEADDWFEKKVRPLLVQHCYECHSEDAEESGLRVDSGSALLRGGERGPAVVPGKPAESLLISAVRHGEVLKMPPKRKLSPQEIADLERWVESGAKWPGEQTAAADAGSSKPAKAAGFTAKQLQHWAFQPLQPVAIPQSEELSESPIDAFVRHRLRARGLAPAPLADKRVLIRRATLDLLGLPPTREEVEGFVADDSPDAWPRLVDRLLSSPHYGERWGRHWLDVARYADSNGLDENLAYANAFRYRDYVVSAWNRDLPFDEFIHEQVAGDLLPADVDTLRQLDRVVATGFLSLGAKMLAEDDPVKMQMDIIDEQVETMGRAFLGMTWGCARCHDHKYDPFDMADYYGIAGIFASTKTMENHQVVARWLERPLAEPAVLAARDTSQAEIRRVDEQIQKRVDGERQSLLAAARRHVGEYLLAAHHANELEKFTQSQRSRGAEPAIRELPGAVWLEAEQYARGNVLQDTTNYGVGIGVLVNRGETPNFTEYDFSVARGGLYQLELRYAAASARPTQLILNGTLVKPTAASEVTGGWQPEHQAWKVEGFFTLREGGNVLRLEQPQFFPHIDKILLFPVPEGTVEPERVRLDESYEPLPEWTAEWRKYLNEPRGDQSTWLREWQALPKHGAAAERRALALRIQEAAEKVVEAWEAAQKQQPARSSLDDPRQEAWRVILYEPSGPFLPTANVEARFPATTREELAALRMQKEKLEAGLPKLPEAMAVVDDAPRDLPIHIRGSHLTLGPVTPRRFPKSLPGNDATWDHARSGRLELAQWLTRPDHPLTARVIANRIWAWHFGLGLVRSVDNFGLLGEPPSHPALLDWLAKRLVDRRWSLKDLHREIMLSETYRQSGIENKQAAELDPDNTLLWRFPRHRMDAETLRDSLLAVSGQIDLRFSGSHLPTPNRQYVTSTANVDPVAYESRRRSLYLPVVRSALYDVFQAFDFADPSVSQGQRETTTIAPQALFLMNSKFVADQTRSLAQDMLREQTRTDEQRVEALFWRALARAPHDGERARALAFVSQYAERAGESAGTTEERRLRAWQGLVRAVLSTNEFVYVE